jgi:hypothetical protein
MTAGRTEEALEEARRGLQVDPLSPVLHRDYGWLLYLARSYDASLKAL